MKTFFFFFFSCLFLWGNGMARADVGSDTLQSLTLDDMPDWILEHIQFPEEAYSYGKAGVESLMLSTSWDGKLFIVGDLNALHPSFEKAIREVVARAPRCGYAGVQPEDIHKFMLVDFYEYIPKERQDGMEQIGLHMPPIFKSPFGGRTAFLQWIYKKLKVPKSLKQAYTDTLTVEYTLSVTGEVQDAKVSGGKNRELEAEVAKLLERVPRWDLPAMVEGNRCIPVVVSDRLIVSIDGKGRKQPFREYVDEVFCNTKTVPDDRTTILLNPETQPCYAGETSFRRELFRDVKVQKKTKVGGSFIIEPDGSVAHVQLTASGNAELDSLLAVNLEGMRWLPGMQDTVAVRTFMSFHQSVSPPVVRKKRMRNNESLYEIYGKYYFALRANPNGIYSGYTDGSGRGHRYPFDARTRFDYNAYYRSLNNYYKQSGGNTKNTSRKYFKTMERLFVK